MMTPDQVANRAKAFAESGYNWTPGFCLRFVRTCAGAPAGTATAHLAWQEADRRHTGGVPPRGAFVFWRGGGRGHGHVAVSDGRGFVWSTDILREGRVDRVTISYLGARWPNMTYLGWAEDINGVIVPGLAPPVPMPTITLRGIRPGQQGEDIRRVQLALRRRGFARLNPSGATGFYGAQTRAMVAAFQRTWAPTHADGLVGTDTLHRLGFAAR